jgi:hypothetical protein
MNGAGSANGTEYGERGVPFSASGGCCVSLTSPPGGKLLMLGGGIPDTIPMRPTTPGPHTLGHEYPPIGRGQPLISAIANTQRNLTANIPFGLFLSKLVNSSFGFSTSPPGSGTGCHHFGLILASGSLAAALLRGLALARLRASLMRSAQSVSLAE